MTSLRKRLDRANWIGVDWGTTHLRAWHLAPAGQVLAAARSPDGAASLSKSDFEPALLALCGSWLDQALKTQVIICGMAGATGGWKEVHYMAVPCRPLDGCGNDSPDVIDPRLDVYILSGLSQLGHHPDVLRGEETQIAGFASKDPDFSGTICLPGTHTKWATLEHGRVTGFQTFMTGELFELLRSRSILARSISSGPIQGTAFHAAVRKAFEQPHALSAELFAIRAASLLSDLSPADAACRLSGLLIGAELANCRSMWEQVPVVIISEPELAELYLRALRTIGSDARFVAAETATLAGLAAARRLLRSV